MRPVIVSLPDVLPVTSLTTALEEARYTMTLLYLAVGFGAKETMIDVGETSAMFGAAGVASVWVTVIVGDFASWVSVPLDVDFSYVVQAIGPTVVVAVAPGPFRVFEP